MVLRSLFISRRLAVALIVTLFLALSALAGNASAVGAFYYGAHYQQHGSACGSGGNEIQIDSRAAYTTGAKVGERWYARIEMYQLGNPCGSEVVSPGITGIPNTYFAIDAAHPVSCELNSNVSNSNGWFDVTDNNNLVYNGQHYTPCHHDTTDGAFAVLGPGQGFRITFPVVSKKALGGMSTSERFQASVHTSLATGTGAPFVWVNVADNPPTISYASPSATDVTTSSAHTAATLLSHFHAGTAYFDIGTSANYGRTESGPITSDNDSQIEYDDWDGLAADTIYHWRLRFVDDQGHTYYGADQSFRTAAAPGAPDRDGDGVADAGDACPDQAAPGTANGCPPPPPTPPADGDGDGIPDSRDACPAQVAPGTANGCPAVTKPPVVVVPPAPQQKCRVPKLTSLSLAKAKRALTKAGCRLGNVSPRHPGRGWVVRRQGAKPGRSLGRGTKISLTLGRPRRHH